MEASKKRGRTAAQDKYDRVNVETISFKARRGSRMRIVEAATATGQSTNGFIRSTLNRAVQEVIGTPMEDERDKASGTDEVKDGE